MSARDRLDAIGARASAATEGPWSFEIHRFKTTVDATTTHPLTGLPLRFSPAPSVIGEENAEFARWLAAHDPDACWADYRRRRIVRGES